MNIKTTRSGGKYFCSLNFITKKIRNTNNNLEVFTETMQNIIQAKSFYLTREDDTYSHDARK